MYAVDIQIYDVRKCFDKLWYAEVANDIFDACVIDDPFVAISNSNQNCQVAVKTPWGKTTTGSLKLRKILSCVKFN